MAANPGDYTVEYMEWYSRISQCFIRPSLHAHIDIVPQQSLTNVEQICFILFIAIFIVNFHGLLYDANIKTHTS